jgi:phosphohistidine phosphatase
MSSTPSSEPSATAATSRYRRRHDGGMRSVYLLRHAKSSWKTGRPDHERPLAGRGRRAAKAIAAHLRDAGIEPELVLCSTARRTRETLELISPALGSAVVAIEQELYGADNDELLERLRAVPDDVASVMLIGHNPGMQELALDLARPSAALRELEAKYPTAALATLAFPGASWQELGPGTSELSGFVKPRDLEP